MAKKTLYVTDLDGTLLRGDQTLSDFAVAALNDLIKKGILFTCATARSYLTAKAVLAPLNGWMPLILKNGAYIAENETGKIISFHGFAPCESKNILDFLMSQKCYPKVYSLIDGAEKYSCYPSKETPSMKRWRQSRPSDERCRTISQDDDLYEGQIFYIEYSDVKERLIPLYNALKEDFCCTLGQELYGGDWWLEVMSHQATKAKAALALKASLSCDRLVCFGDGINDISLFEVADECYAVGNAVNQLKDRATGIIESNEKDGVVRFLQKRFL